jgi:hypothetical protein
LGKIAHGETSELGAGKYKCRLRLTRPTATVVPTGVHAMIAYKYHKRVPQMILSLHSFKDHTHDIVHFTLLG